MNESISMIGRNVMMMCGALIAIIKPTIPFIIICTEALGDDDGETTGNPDCKSHNQEI